jgi:hypothetical protein
LEEEYLQNAGSPEEAGQIVSEMNTYLDREIERISAENARMDRQLAQAGMDNMQELTVEIAEEIAPEETVLPEISMEGIEEEESVLPGLYGDGDTEEGSSTEEDAAVSTEPEEDLSVEEVAVPEVSIGEMPVTSGALSGEAQAEPDSQSMAVSQDRNTGRSSRAEAGGTAAKSSTRRMPFADDTGRMTSWKIKTANLPEISMPEDLGLDDEPATENVIDHLTDEQKAIFSYFVPVKGMETQLCRTHPPAILSFRAVRAVERPCLRRASSRCSRRNADIRPARLEKSMRRR